MHLKPQKVEFLWYSPFKAASYYPKRAKLLGYSHSMFSRFLQWDKATMDHKLSQTEDIKAPDRAAECQILTSHSWAGLSGFNCKESHNHQCHLSGLTSAQPSDSRLTAVWLLTWSFCVYIRINAAALCWLRQLVIPVAVDWVKLVLQQS